MISIIIVDDDPNKVKEIKKTLLEIKGILSENIDVATNFIQAKKMVGEKKYDLMLLDIYLPIRDGEEVVKHGGISLLKDISISPDNISPGHIIGITIYDCEEFKKEFEDNLWFLIDYDIQSINWKILLTRKVEYLIKLENEESKESYNYDIAIITSMRDPELLEILNLDANWSEINIKYDHINYYSGIFKKGEKELKVIAASANDMGLTATSLVTSKMIFHFRP